MHDPHSSIYDLRLRRSADDLDTMLGRLYGGREDYGAFRNALDDAMRAAWGARSDALRTLDLARDLEPDWFQRPGMAGYVFYVDRFAGTLDRVPERLDHLQDLGIT